MSRPTFQLLCSHPAHLLSLGFGSGLSPKAPGTVGSVLAWLLYPLLVLMVPPAWFGLFLLACFALGCVAVSHTGKALGVVDHGGIVWDEFVALWLVQWLVPASWPWQLAALISFRFFDILKPWPIRVADARLKNGFGVMFDDLLAAGYSLLVLLIAAQVLA
ncbi:phosphatidylglycerophosphatase A [Uliginosibacterium sediminicola]|uniref:Phosphatidylglycerophosphatase A n=1 Tax=Uliginosibacterium sediminicola TaxID=2024550 RepID=A0ABU9YYW4_9RHOO